MSKVKEFVQIVRELDEEMAAAHLRQFPDSVVGSWASTIFINQNARTPQQASPQEEIRGELKWKGEKTDKNGKKFYITKIDETYCNTYSTDSFGGLKFSIGDKVKANVQRRGSFVALISMEPDGDSEPKDLPF